MMDPHTITGVRMDHYNQLKNKVEPIDGVVETTPSNIGPVAKNRADYSPDMLSVSMKEYTDVSDVITEARRVNEDNRVLSVMNHPEMDYRAVKIGTVEHIMDDGFDVTGLSISDEIRSRLADEPGFSGVRESSGTVVSVGFSGVMNLHGLIELLRDYPDMGTLAVSWTENTLAFGAL